MAWLHALPARSDQANACLNQATTGATEFGRFYSDTRDISTGFSTVQIGDAGAPVRYTRLLIESKTPQAAGWVLSIRGDNNELLESFGQEQFSGHALRWTRRLDVTGSSLRMELDARFSNNIPQLRILKIVSMPAAATKTYYSASDPKAPRWSPIASASSGDRKHAESVGMLIGNSNDKTWCCSGVVIAENLLLTNWHCGSYTESSDDKWSPEACRNMVINLAWDQYGNQDQKIHDREFVCDAVLATDQDLDIAVIKIRSLLGHETARPIKIRTKPLDNNEALSLIHHPACLPKQLTSTSCQVDSKSYRGWRNAAAKTEILHSCDTEGGSSGAPILDEAGNLVALHHLGYETPPGGVCDYQNKGVKIGPILEFLMGKDDIRQLLVGSQH